MEPIRLNLTGEQFSYYRRKLEGFIQLRNEISLNGASNQMVSDFAILCRIIAAIRLILQIGARPFNAGDVHTIRLLNAHLEQYINQMRQTNNQH